jgi:hypothetical protein
VSPRAAMPRASDSSVHGALRRPETTPSASRMGFQ